MLTPHGYTGLQGSPLQKKKKKISCQYLCCFSGQGVLLCICFFWGGGVGDKDVNGFKVMVVPVFVFFMK